MIRALYDRTIALAETRYALFALALVAFVESSVFPIPPDVMLIPMILAARDRAWLIAGVCTIASVLGGGAGYWIGMELLETVGRPALELYGKADRLPEFSEWYAEWGVWAVLIAGITPFPYKVITIASGAAGFDFWAFMASSVVARGLRFFIVAWLLWKFGPPIRAFIEERLGLVFTVFMICLVGGFVALRYI
ncbi:MAG: YqaA family protein [Pseudomonadota bacterium]